MKRFTQTLLLALSILIPPTTHGLTLEVWSAFDGDLLYKVAQRFKQETGHELVIRNVDTNSMRAETLLAERFEAYLPDVVWVPSDFLGMHDYLGLQAIPDDWITSSELEASAFHHITTDNQYYALPISLGNHLMLYYNKSLVQTPATSWEALITTTRETKKPVVLMDYKQNYYLAAFFSLFTDDNPFAILEFEASTIARSFEFYKELIDQGVFFSQCDSLCPRTRFIAEKSAYLIDGDWAMNSMDDEFKAKVGIAPLPTLNGKKMTSLSGGKILAFTQRHFADPEKRQAMKQLSELVQRPAFLKELMNNNIFISANQSVNAQFFSEPNSIDATMYRLYLQSQPMNTSLKMAIYWEAMFRGYMRYQKGSPADESAQYVIHFLNKYFDKVDRRAEK